VFVAEGEQNGTHGVSMPSTAVMSNSRSLPAASWAASHGDPGSAACVIQLISEDELR
jgi:hypothetical protein